MEQRDTAARPRSRGRPRRRKLKREARSKWKLAAGAAGLFLFIVGVKRSWPGALAGRADAEADGPDADAGEPAR